MSTVAELVPARLTGTEENCEKAGARVGPPRVISDDGGGRSTHYFLASIVGDYRTPAPERTRRFFSLNSPGLHQTRGGRLKRVDHEQ